MCFFKHISTKLKVILRTFLSNLLDKAVHVPSSVAVHSVDSKFVVAAYTDGRIGVFDVESAACVLTASADMEDGTKEPYGWFTKVFSTYFKR